jgi:hypothetical protein
MNKKVYGILWMREAFIKAEAYSFKGSVRIVRFLYWLIMIIAVTALVLIPVFKFYNAVEDFFTPGILTFYLSISASLIWSGYINYKYLQQSWQDLKKRNYLARVLNEGLFTQLRDKTPHGATMPSFNFIDSDTLMTWYRLYQLSKDIDLTTKKRIERNFLLYGFIYIAIVAILLTGIFLGGIPYVSYGH